MKNYVSMTAVLLAFALAVSGCDTREEKAVQYIANGQKYLAAEDYDSAKIEFANALQIDPQNVAALTGMSDIYQAKQQLPELYRSLKTLVEINPDDVDTRLRFTNLLATANKVDDALEQANLMLNMAPDRAEVRVVRAGLLFRSGNIKGGVEEAKKAIELNPNNTIAYYLLGNSLLSEQKPQQALDTVNAGLSVDPDDMPLNSIKIYALNGLKRFDEAVAVFKHLAELKPTNTPLHRLFATQYLSMGLEDEAEALLTKFATRERSGEALLTVIDFLMRHKGREVAERQLQDYIVSYPALAELKFALADIYLHTGRQDDARQLMETMAASEGTSATGLRAKNALARFAQRSGDSKTADALLAQILAVDPQNLDATLSVARADIAAGRGEKTVRDLRAALNFAPASDELQLLLGQAHELQKMLELAQDHYAKALQLSGGKPLVVGEYARFMMRQGQQGQAEDLLERAQRKTPDNPQILKLLAQVKLNLAKWEEAQGYADRLQAIGDNDQLANEIRGVAYSGQSEFDKSIEYFKQAQQAAPDDYKLMATLVGTYLRAGKREQAETFLNDIINGEPDNAGALLLKGTIHEQYREFAPAEAAFRQAIAAAPQVQQGYRLLTRVLLKQDKVEQALAAVDGGLQSMPDNLELAIVRAQLQQKLGDNAGAIATYRAAIKARPKADVVYNNLALMLLSEGGQDNTAEALALAERFRNSEIPQFQDTLGWIYLQTGNKSEAQYLLEKAAEALPGLSEVRYHLGLAYLANERRLEARRELELALREGPADSEWRGDAEQALQSLAP